MNQIQPLDNEAFSYIKAQREQKETYAVISKELTELGYTTTIGNKLHNADISRFAIKCGLRTNFPVNKVKTKNFNPVALEKLFRESIASGKSRRQIARIFNTAGYTTFRGNKFTVKDVYNFEERRVNVYKDVEPPTTRTIVKAEPTVDDITAIVKSSLPKHLKLKILSDYV